MNVTEKLMRQLQVHLTKRSKETKIIHSLMNAIAVATDRPIPSGEENPLDYADEVIVSVLNPSIKFIQSGGRLTMSEDHQAHRHEYNIKLVVDFAK